MADRTFLGSISTVDVDQRNASYRGLVGHKQSKLIETPSALITSLKLGSNRNPLSNSLKIFESDQGKGVFSLSNQNLGDAMVTVSGESCHSTRQLLKMSFSALGSNTLEPGLESIRFGSDVLNFLTRMYHSIAIYGQILDTKINTENSNRIIGRSFRSINHNAKVENSFDKDQVCLASDPIHPGFLIFSETNRDKLSALKRDQRDHLKSFPRENALIVNDGPIESELWLDRFVSLIRFADLGNGSDSKLCGESKMFSNRIVNRLMDLNLVGTMQSKNSLCYVITSLVKPLHCLTEHLMLLWGGVELYHQGLKHYIEDSLQRINRSWCAATARYASPRPKCRGFSRSLIQEAL